jgi:hypothetical protein
VGSLNRDEFQKALNEPLSLENTLNFSLYDFLTPLKTFLKAKKKPLDMIFEVKLKPGAKTITTDTIK